MRLLLLLSLVSACAPAERDPLDRTPPSATCDGTDPVRCQLPWPSNAFTVADPSTETGLRVALDPAELRVPDDDPTCLNRQDGFSRATGVAVGLQGEVDPAVLSSDPADSLAADAPLQVITIQADHPEYGQRRAFRTEARTANQAGGVRTMIVGRPAEVLPPAADHALILLDTVGGDYEAPRAVRVALGLDPADTDRERVLAENYAPVAHALQDADVDLQRVIRVSWFTTRSRADGTARMHALVAAQRAAVADATIVIDRVRQHESPDIALIVNAHLEGMPSFLDEDGRMVFDDDGLPLQTGTRDVPFRVLLPANVQTYKVALFGHGTGGNEDDTSFDTRLASAGLAKVNLRFDGWTDDEFLSTSFDFTKVFEASDRSTSKLSQALSAGPALLDAFEGELADILAQDEIGGVDNPNAGARPDLAQPAWLGGSLGGTLGAVLVGVEPRIQLAVFNVPGAGWTHFIPDSYFWELGLSGVVERTYGEGLDTHHAIVMSQGCWDDVDGAVYADELVERDTTVLLQESIGDPVLPNLGTELLAASLNATVLAPDINPVVGLPVSEEPVHEGAALTQFKVPDTGEYDVHGFAARNTPAGRAAIGQIMTMLQAAWDEGEPLLAHPDGCSVTDDGSCDFSGMWE